MSYEFTADEINGDALREDFMEKFLEENSTNWAHHTMEELIELFGEQLGEAKNRWSSIDTGYEYAEMDRWLGMRGYIEPDYRD